ncbi:MAG: RluA family pseudouridine synthase [Planctomycetota bacterium]
MLHELAVEAEAAGTRLDVWLESRLEGCSRSLVARSIKAGRCRVEPGRTKPGYRLRGGERVALEVEEVPALTVVPEPMALRILHEDDALLVLDKPAGVVVHPAIGHIRGTLLGGLLAYAQQGGSGWAPLLVHRLDADTSGVMAVAKTPAAQAACQDAFRERRVGKRYCALVHGQPQADYFDHHGWIGRSRRDFRKRRVWPEGTSGARAAHSEFHVRARGHGFSVLEVRIHTGRTHQIRVHLADLGHPCLADARYGREAEWSPPGDTGPPLTRQALHAWRLALPHPDGSVLTVTAAPPPDLDRFLPPGLEPLPA